MGTMETTQPDGPQGPLNSHDLIQLAQAHGYTVTVRMLETFRSQGLMPRTQRVGYRGRAPIWAYPTGADQQLLTLLKWREYTTEKNVLIPLLWLAGHVEDLNAVRQALLAELNQAERVIRAELTAAAALADIDVNAEGGEDAAVKALAESLSRRKEINTVLPRSVSADPEERADTIATLTNMFLTGRVSDRGEEHAQDLERRLGMDLGRQPLGEIPPWLTGPATELLDALSDLNLENMRNIVSQATPAQWAWARPLADGMLRLLPVALAMMKALSGEDNPLGFGLFGGLGDDPTSVVLIIPLVLLTQPSADIDALRQTLQELEQLAPQGEVILDLPQTALQHSLAQLSETQRDSTQRVVDALVEEKFTPAPERKPAHKPPRRRA